MPKNSSTSKSYKHNKECLYGLFVVYE